MVDESLFGLTERQKNTIHSILTNFAEDIQKVDVFGSRATGVYRKNSDLDIVIYGELSEAQGDRLWTLLNDASLPFHVDITLYNSKLYQPFRNHIDRFSITLFSAADLSS